MFKKTMIIAAAFSAGFAAQGSTAQAAFRHHGSRHHAFFRSERHRAVGHFAHHHDYRHVAHHWGHSSHSRTAFSIRSPQAAAEIEHFVASTGSVQEGRASFYAGGGHTASGGRVGAATCAHRSLPFGTRVLVTNLTNSRQAVLTVNDRGPFVGGRILDVSRGAAGMLGMLHAGVSQIRMQVIGGAG